MTLNELQLKKAYASDTEAAFLDLNLSIHNSTVSTKIYDKRDDFDSDIVNFPFLNGDVPRRPSYGIYILMLKQNYPESLIDGGIEKAMNLEKNTLRTVKDRTEDQVMPYVSTHYPKNPEIYIVFQFNLFILHEDPKMSSILSNFKMIKSKRQPKNLKRLLTKAKFNSNNYHEVKRF